MLTRADWKANRPISHIWRQDIGGAPVQLTNGDAGEIRAGSRWSPDSKTMLFLRGGQIQTRCPPMAASREP